MQTPDGHEDTVIIGIGEHHIGSCPMSCIGLGSCIGLIIHDRERETGGMAHVMLPTSQGRSGRPGKYADTAIPFLLEKMESAGSRKRHPSR